MNPYASSDLTGMDFRAQEIDLSGQSLANSILTGCKFYRCNGTQFFRCTGSDCDFSGVDISGANFDKAEAGIIASLVGAEWNGQTITKVSPWLSQEHPRWCFCTNAFVSVGCMVKTLAEWEAIGQSLETLTAWGTPLHVDIQSTWAWWQATAPVIRQWFSEI